MVVYAVRFFSELGLTTLTLVALTNDSLHFSIDCPDMQVLEWFVALMYSRRCGLENVKQDTGYLITRGSKALENISPTQAALLEGGKWVPH